MTSCWLYFTLVYLSTYPLLKGIYSKRNMGGGVGGWGGGGWVTSYIWHSTDVRAENPLFQRCQVYG